MKTSLTKNDTIVLLHGILRSKRSMLKLQRYFERQGFNIINIDYPSTRFTMEQLIDYIHTPINTGNANQSKKIHFIGHSMGNLLIRGYLQKYRPTNLGRVVMIAPPNQGSELADFYKNFFLYKMLYGPAGQQLTTDQTSIEKYFGEINYEVGIIAGDRTIDPISSLMLPGKNDGKVSIEKTRIEGACDHIVIHATHTFIMQNTKTIRLAEQFIKMGRFA